MRFLVASLFVALFAFYTVNAQSVLEQSHTLEKRLASTPYVSPDVLMDGTLFYIGLSISLALWSTGKFIDVKLQRQERHAENVANSI